MAVLQKIRGWGIWLSLIIAFALLLFLLDPTSISQFFGIGAYKQDPVGYVNGKDISYAEFIEASNKYEPYKNYLGVNDDQVMKSTAFRSLLYSRLLMPKMEEAGLYFTESEVNEALLTNGVSAGYTQIPAQTVQMFVSAAEQGNPAVSQVIDVLRQDAKNELYARNYARLIAQANYPNDLYLDRLEADYNSITPIDVIVLQPSNEGVTVSDDELRSEYKLHKYYNKPRSREVAYIDFHVYPSAEDMEAAEQKYMGQYETFVSTDNMARFLKANSADKEVKFYHEGELPEELNSLVFGAGQNQTEMLKDEDEYSFTSARVLSSEVRSFSGSVKVYGFEDAAKADSLVACLNAGEPADSLKARHEIYEFSASQSVNRNQATVSLGNNALQLKGILDEPVNNFKVYQAGTEKYACALESKDEPALLKEVAIFSVYVKPSDETDAEVKNRAYEFVSAATGVERANLSELEGDVDYFEATVIDGMEVFQTLNGPVDKLNNLTRNIFDAKLGSVIYESAGPYDYFAIAVKSDRAEGPATLEEVRDDLNETLMTRKAAESRLAEVRAELKDAEDLSVLAEKWGESVREMTVGYNTSDPRLFGAVSAYAEGEMGAVAGKDGKVYVFKVKQANAGNHTGREDLRTRYARQNAHLTADYPAYMGWDFNFLALPDALRSVIRSNDVKDHTLRF